MTAGKDAGVRLSHSRLGKSMAEGFRPREAKETGTSGFLTTVQSTATMGCSMQNVFFVQHLKDLNKGVGIAGKSKWHGQVSSEWYGETSAV